MIELQVNGHGCAFALESCTSFDEILALIREEKSPDEVIASAWWNGAPLSEADLQRVPQRERGVLSVHTRRKEAYVLERLEAADRYVLQFSDTFAQSIHAFRTGHAGYGNTFLARGVDELLSFVAWYSTILAHLDSGMREAIKGNSVESAFHSIVRDIQRVSERLVQAQLLESSFTVASELELSLRPQLERLRVFCRETSEKIRQNRMECS